MDNPIILSVIITAVMIIVLVPVCILIFKRADEKCKNKSKFNNIQIGMSETQLYSEFGAPKQIFEADSATKVLTYREYKYAMLFLIRVGIEAQVSVKNGVVTNVVVSVKN